MSKKYKIILLLSLLLIFFKYQSLSQFSDRFGVNLILSASKQNIEGTLDYYEGYNNYKFKTDFLYGFGIGLFYELYRTKSFILCLNFEYIQKGTETYVLIPNGIESYADEAKMYNKIDCLSLPIYTKIFLFDYVFKPYIFLGLRLDGMISYDTDYLKYYFKEANTFVYGSEVGIGCELIFNEYLTLLPSIRYNLDFNSTIEQNDLKFKNRSLDFSLGVKIK